MNSPEGTPGTVGILATVALGFLAYYLGIVIRKVALPGKHSPSLRDQLLLGLPISLGVISSLVAILNTAIKEADAASFLATLGLIMEHGMVLNETLTRRLQEITGRPKDD